MGKQTQDYIKLKAISEKFNSVAESITEDEVRDLIVGSIKERIDESIKNLDSFYRVDEIAENWIGSNSFFIEKLICDSITNKFSR